MDAKMKVGDKVKVIGGYGGAFSGRFGVLTEISGGGCMVTTRKGLPEHTGDSDRPDDDFHLCFLKSQVSAPIQHIGTLADIGAQVGDVVEWVSDDGVSKISIGHVGRKHTIQSDGRVMLNGGGGCYWGVLGEDDDYMGVKWRIVSRASDLSKLDYTPINLEKPIYDIEPDTRPLEHFQSGPVITETVKRIVPGVYGRVKINHHAGGIVQLQFNGVQLTAAVQFTRAELIAARGVLSQLIDAMPSE